MVRFVVARLAAAALTMLLVVAIAFFLMRLAPGGPFDQERTLDPAIKAGLEHLYGLDRPLPVQFWLYLKALAHGDLGPSTHWRDFSVNDLFATALPISIRLGAEALGLALVLGIPIGVIGAGGRSGFASRAVVLLALAGLAVPPFVVAPLMQVWLGLDLHLMPVGGWGDGAWAHQILPVLTLALPQVAIIAKLTQAAMREALAAPHIRTLRAYGLPRHLVARHALRGAILPVLSYCGPAAAALLTGSIVVETIFGIPGIGRYFVDGALSRDYTLTMATVVTVGAMIVVLNLAVDLAYGVLDPRVRSD